MRKFFLLLVIICLPGCDWNRDFGHPPPMTLRGAYKGQLSATYPGPDCGAITVEDSIRMVLTDSRFFYYWHNGTIFDTIAAGQGTYMIENNVIFINEMEPETNPLLTIDGTFNLRWVHTDSQPDTMILSQGATPDINSFFETQYLITLVRSDEIPD